MLNLLCLSRVQVKVMIVFQYEQGVWFVMESWVGSFSCLENFYLIFNLKNYHLICNWNSMRIEVISSNVSKGLI